MSSLSTHAADAPQCPPVLLVLFNRPDLASQVLERIREARPQQLFIAVDGPRPDRPGEVENVEQCRQLVDRVDWDCQAETLFRLENLGCRQAVSQAISWFFTHVDEGIILEDDCLPEPSFFRYTAELLERFSDDERVMCISGDNPLAGHFHTEDSYYFSVTPFIWGWATWRRAWNLYENYPPAPASIDWLNDFLASEEAASYWKRMIDRTNRGEINTWDTQWLYSCWQNHGLTAVPASNLISNVGFDNRASHTRNADHWEANRATSPVTFPLKHPQQVVRNYEVDALIWQIKFSIKKKTRRFETFGMTIDDWATRLSLATKSLRRQMARLHPRRVLGKVGRMTGMTAFR